MKTNPLRAAKVALNTAEHNYRKACNQHFNNVIAYEAAVKTYIAERIKRATACRNFNTFSAARKVAQRATEVSRDEHETAERIHVAALLNLRVALAAARRASPKEQAVSPIVLDTFLPNPLTESSTDNAAQQLARA